MDRRWIKGFVSSRLVSFRLGNASSRGIWEIGRPGSGVAMSCPGVGGRWCCSALYYPWQGTENTGDGDAGRAGRGDNRRAQYAGSGWWTQHAAQTAGRRYRRSRRAGAAGGNGWAAVVMVVAAAERQW